MIFFFLMSLRIIFIARAFFLRTPPNSNVWKNLYALFYASYAWLRTRLTHAQCVSFNFFKTPLFCNYRKWVNCHLKVFQEQGASFHSVHYRWDYSFVLFNRYRSEQKAFTKASKKWQDELGVKSINKSFKKIIKYCRCVRVIAHTQVILVTLLHII